MKEEQGESIIDMQRVLVSYRRGRSKYLTLNREKKKYK